MLLNGCSSLRSYRRAVIASLLAPIFFTYSALAQQAAAASTEKPLAFEVVAVKLTDPDNHSQSWRGTYNRLTIQNYTLRHLIRIAYDLKSDSQVIGGPEWLDKQGFDIAAKLDDADVARLKDGQNQDRRDAINRMLQTTLTERFHLQVSPGEQTRPVYALLVAKSGAKLTALPAPKDPDEHRNHSMNTNNGHLTATAISMDSFADYLTLQPETDRIVVNRTGLGGDFDFKLNWTEDYGGGIPGDAADPGLFTALQDQLGLELKPDKGSVPTVTVLAASKPDLD